MVNNKGIPRDFIYKKNQLTPQSHRQRQFTRSVNTRIPCYHYHHNIKRLDIKKETHGTENQKMEQRSHHNIKKLERNKKKTLEFHATQKTNKTRKHQIL